MIRRYSVEPSTSIGGPLYSGLFLVSWDISVVPFSVISRTGRLVGEVLLGRYSLTPARLSSLQSSGWSGLFAGKKQGVLVRIFTNSAVCSRFN